jgi:predicted membrane chloride channel (bestrophin family)
MPFALAHNFGDNDWAIVACSAFISFFFLGIDELGVQIEEPVSIEFVHVWVWFMCCVVLCCVVL